MLHKIDFTIDGNELVFANEKLSYEFKLQFLVIHYKGRYAYDTTQFIDMPTYFSPVNMDTVDITLCGSRTTNN